MSVTYYENPDGSLAHITEDGFMVVTSGEVHEGAEEITEAEHDALVAALAVEVEDTTAALIADAAVAQAAADAARSTVLAALAASSGLTAEEIEEALG